MLSDEISELCNVLAKYSETGAEFAPRGVVEVCAILTAWRKKAVRLETRCAQAGVVDISFFRTVRPDLTDEPLEEPGGAA